MGLDDLTADQRINIADKANELLASGLLQTVTQELTGNYIERLKELEPSDNIGREHLISRLCVLGDVAEDVAAELQKRSADGDMAFREMSLDER